MKKGFQKIASVLLACLVLVSTVSFTVEKHFCGRFLVDIAVFSKAKDCGMDMMDHTDSQQLVEVKKPSCCKDEIIVVKGQDELKTSFDHVTIPSQVFIASFFDSYLYVFSLGEEKNTICKEYDPPEIVRDIQTLHETFLI